MESVEHTIHQRGQPSGKPLSRDEKKLRNYISNNWPRTESELIKQFLNELIEKGKKASTVLDYYYSLIKYFETCRKKSGLNSKAPMDVIILYIDQKRVSANIEHLRIRSVSRRNFRNVLMAVRVFYGWLVNQGLIDRNPIDSLRKNPVTLDKIKPKFAKPKAGISIIHAVEKWLDYNKRLARHTQRRYHDNIIWFVESLPDDVTTIEKITHVQIRDYVSGLLKKGLKRSSINTHFIAIKSFCRWLKEEYDIDNVSLKVRTLKADPPEARFLGWDEYQKVLSVCSKGEGQIIKLFGNTGLRVSELIGLCWGDISPDYKMINPTGKGQKFRHIPCNEIVQGILKGYERRDDSERIQTRYKSRDSISWLCLKLSRKAEIKRFGPHSLRHLFATELLKRGVPIAYVSKVLGHSSITVTEKLYVHWQPEYLNGITDVLLQEGGRNHD